MSDTTTHTPLVIVTNDSFHFMRRRVIFIGLMAILLGLTAWWGVHYKNVAEKELTEARLQLDTASRGKSFYLLQTDGNCQEVKVRFNGQRPVWILGPTLIGLKRPSGAVYVESRVNDYPEENCHQSVSMALQ